jgi:orotidine-5'-phosphate decarboxylase
MVKKSGKMGKVKKLTKKQKRAREKICLPLDNLHSLKEIKNLVKELSPFVGIFKIGKETYTRFGPEAVKIVHAHGSKVFLDLKYHDIPNTVKGAAKAATDLGVHIFNVHASGGLEMMKAALQGIKESKKLKKPKVIAVTMLTSLDKEIMNKQLKLKGKIEYQVLHLAKLAKKSGLDGIVCSANDLKAIKNKLPKKFMFVTPGIKGPSTNAGKDQKRVSSPKNAIKNGSTILVIGRAITKAKNRAKAALEILEDLSK